MTSEHLGFLEDSEPVDVQNTNRVVHAESVFGGPKPANPLFRLAIERDQSGPLGDSQPSKGNAV